MGKNVIRIPERRAEPAVYMSALDRLMAGEGFDAAALVEELEAIERAGQRPPPQFGEKLLAALHALFIAAAERRRYEQGLIDGYKLAVTDIFRWYEERLEKLIRGFGRAAVVPLAEPLAERRERPRGRPAEDDTPHVGEMVRIIIKDGNTFGDRKAVSKAADQAAEGVPRRHEKKREDVAKTLRYKFEKTLRGLNHLRFADSVADFARLSIQVSEERRRHGADVLAQFNALQHAVDDSLRSLLETGQALGDNRQKKN
jgi:hypothetical protein